MATKKYLSLERLQEYDDLIKVEIDKKADSAHTHSWDELTNKPFGELIAGEYTTWLEDCYATGNGRKAYIYGSGGYTPAKSMTGLIGKNVRVTLNGDVYESVCYISPNGRITVEAGEYIIGHMVTDLEPWIEPTVNGQRYEISKIEVAEVSETKLPEKYLPEHTHDLPEHTHEMSDINGLSNALTSNLDEAKLYTDTAVSQKSVVQIIKWEAND